MVIYIIFLCTIFLFKFIEGLSLPIKNIFSDNINNFNKNQCAIKHKANYSQRKVSHMMSIALIVIYFFSAFRFRVGWDYSYYYNTIVYGYTTNINGLNECATIFLVDIAKLSGVTNIYFAINSFICIFFIMSMIKKYSYDRWLSLIFFVCFPLFYLNSFSVIRMFSAVAISFYGFKYIINKNLFKYTITVIIASLFHKSAIVAIILYFAAHHIKMKTSKLIMVLALLPLLSNLFQRLIMQYFPRYGIYFNPTDIQEGTKAIVIFVIIGVISLIFRTKIIKNDNAASLYFNIYFIGLAIYLAFLELGTLGHRFSLYGTIYSILLVPKIISLFGTKNERVFFNTLVYLSCIAMFIYTIYVGKTTYIPYRTIWNKGGSL